MLKQLHQSSAFQTPTVDNNNYYYYCYTVTIVHEVHITHTRKTGRGRRQKYNQ